MTKIIRFPLKPDGKFGLKPASKKFQKDSGQLDLFQSPAEARVVSLDAGSPYQMASELHEKNPERAIALYQEAINKDQQVADAFCNMGILHAQLGNTEKAIDALTKSLHEEPRHFEAHFNLANLYADEGNHRLAILHYQLASEIDPDDPNIFYNLCLVLAQEERYPDALTALRTYMENTPQTDPEAVQMRMLLEQSIQGKIS